ncbi:hypothetical protein JAO73_05800 [Hymenobacter sp. BT523]|uniref:hypothetical protein n=1 Tax=Hymenobacter sp. BT523 TaxID=2795725 RepID=UPI0018EA7AC4|nr:hypothetical protein [Hymenobacter sp. BT523]MBJ6108513.1 hypothetical protein [Hymenobacter sp. BT523]
MQLQSIVDLPQLAIGYDADNEWLYVDWKGEHDPDTSQACCLLMLESLRAWPCSKILNDNSNIIRTTMQLREWSMWWLEQMLEAGLQHLAWVLPRHLISREGTEAAVRVIARPHVATFDDVASAYVWLQQRPPVQPCPLGS